jgi:DHA1 family inner membrane transport protein
MTDATTKMPWSSLLVLGGATFTMVTAEMTPTAVLPQMSAGLGVTEPQVGLLVSIWAAVVVVASFPLVRLTARVDRRAVITGSLVLLAVSAVLTALAPDYAFAIGARLLGALAVGLLWATTNAFTADLVADRELARAVAVVLGGATFGMVIGTPAASLVADAAGWRAPFAVLAALALAAAVLVRTIVVRPAVAVSTSGASPIGRPDVTAAGRDAGARLRGIRPLLVVTALAALMFVGHYGAYTFITRLVEAPAAVLPGGVGVVLLVFGLASAAGVAIAGRFGARTVGALLVSAAVTSAAVLALAVVEAHPGAGIAVVVVWGAASGALPPLAQTLILRLAGTRHRAFAGALIPVLFNLGIAVGAALASAAVGSAGLDALPPLSAGVVAVATIGLAGVVVAQLRPSRRRPAAVRETVRS